MVKVSSFFVPKGFRAITIWPFIFVRTTADLDDAILLQHERIHLRQQLEGVLLFFYAWYLVEFLVRYCRTGSRMQAYRNLCMEREAYTHEADPHYLNRRKPFAFLRYL